MTSLEDIHKAINIAFDQKPYNNYGQLQLKELTLIFKKKGNCINSIQVQRSTQEVAIIFGYSYYYILSWWFHSIMKDLI